MTGDEPRDSAAGRVRAELLRVAGAAGERTLWLAPGTVPAAEPGATHRDSDGADTVVLDGVLEQDADPDGLLRAVLKAGLLGEGGRLVVGVRNAAHAGVLSELLAGVPSGTGAGLLDRRQRAWFTLDTLRTLLEASGFVVVEVHRVLRDLEGPARAGFEGLAAVAGLADGTDVRTESYVVVARQSGAVARLAELSAALADAAAEADALRDQARAAADRLAGVQELIADERAEHARLVEDGRRDLVALRAENADLARRLAAGAAALAQAEAASATVRTSAAYRTGERVLATTGPLRAVRRRVRQGVGAALKRVR